MPGIAITWLGHSTFHLALPGGEVVLIDPWLSNPKFPEGFALDRVDVLLLTHGHFDHIMDIPEIVSKTEATIYCGEGIDDTLIQKGVKQDLIQLMFLFQTQETKTKNH